MPRACDSNGPSVFDQLTKTHGSALINASDSTTPVHIDNLVWCNGSIEFSIRFAGRGDDVVDDLSVMEITRFRFTDRKILDRGILEILGDMSNACKHIMSVHSNTQIRLVYMDEEMKAGFQEADLVFERLKSTLFNDFPSQACAKGSWVGMMTIMPHELPAPPEMDRTAIPNITRSVVNELQGAGCVFDPRSPIMAVVAMYMEIPPQMLSLPSTSVALLRNLGIAKRMGEKVATCMTEQMVLFCTFLTEMAEAMRLYRAGARDANNTTTPECTEVCRFFNDENTVVSNKLRHFVADLLRQGIISHR